MTKSSHGLPLPCSLIIANLFQTVLHEKLQFNFTNQCGFQVSSRLSYFKQNFVEFAYRASNFMVSSSSIEHKKAHAWSRVMCQCNGFCKSSL